MPEPSGSPSNPSPSASEFFDASSIISAVQGERDLVEETTEATKSTSENTQSILDEIRGDIGSTVKKIAESSKVSREDLVLKENTRLKQFGDLISNITRVSDGVGRLRTATSGFFEFAINRFVSLTLGVSLAVVAIRSGFDKVITTVQSTLFSLAQLSTLVESGIIGSAIRGIFTAVTGTLKIVANLFTRGFFTKILSGAETLSAVLRENTNLSGFAKRLLNFANNIATSPILKKGSGFLKFIGTAGKFFTFIGKTLGFVLRIVSKVGSVLGKLFFPITLGISIIQGLFDFIREGGEGGIGGLFLKIGNALIENLTFGLLDLRTIIGTLDTAISGLRIAINKLPGIADANRAKELELGLLSRRIGRERGDVITALTEAGVPIQTARLAADADGFDISRIQNDEIREARRAAGADEEFAELREARLEFVKASRDANTEIAGAILEVTALTARQQQQVSNILTSNTQRGIGPENPPAGPSRPVVSGTSQPGIARP